MIATERVTQLISRSKDITPLCAMYYILNFTLNVYERQKLRPFQQQSYRKQYPLSGRIYTLKDNSYKSSNSLWTNSDKQKVCGDSK